MSISTENPATLKIPPPWSPRAGWAMAMRWHDLLFMHWPVPAGALRPLVPPGLELDTFDGSAWLGVVPFQMSGVRPRFVPSIPWLSAFAELNVRTYVRAEGRPGVWFFSLDAANPVAVRAARWNFHLNYLDAAMRVTADGDSIDYESARTHRGAPPARLSMRYRPTRASSPAASGSLDDFLTNRLCLYAANRRGRLFRGDIDHAPWPLQPAEAEVRVNTMADAIGIALPQTAPLLHFARRLDVVAWRLRRVGP